MGKYEKEISYLLLAVLVVLVLVGCGGGGGSNVAGGGGNSNTEINTPVSTAQTLTTDNTGNIKSQGLVIGDMDITISKSTTSGSNPLPDINVNVSKNADSYYLLFSDQSSAEPMPTIPIAFNTNKSTAKEIAATNTIPKNVSLESSLLACGLMSASGIFNFSWEIVKSGFEGTVKIAFDFIKQPFEIHDIVQNTPIAIESSDEFVSQAVNWGGVLLCENCTVGEAADSLNQKVKNIKRVITLNTYMMPALKPVKPLVGVLLGMNNLFTQLQASVFCFLGYNESTKFNWYLVNDLLTPIPTTSPAIIKQNIPPSVISVTANPQSVNVGETLFLSCLGKDLDGDDTKLTYKWSLTGGSIEDTGSKVLWKSPATPGTFHAICTVSDGGYSTSQEISIVVSDNRLPDPSGLNGHPKCTDNVPGIELDWNPVPDAERYKVYRNGSLIYTTSTGNPYFWNTSGVFAGQSYQYQVVGVNSTRESNISPPINVTAPTCGNPILIDNKPDLVVFESVVGVGPTSVTAGSNVAVSYKIQNQGLVNAVSSITRIQIKNSATNALLTEQYFSTQALSSGISTNESRTLTIPSIAAAGVYKLYVILDSNNSTGQSNTSNDFASTTLTIVSGNSSQSDLIPQSLTVSPNSGLAGSGGTVSFTVRNQGSGPSNPCTTNIRISTSSSNVTTSDPLLTSVSIPSIAAGGTYNVSQSVTIPSSRPTGTNYVWVITDVDSTANQSTETNDRAYTAFTVTAAQVPAPSISSISPNPVTGTNSRQTITINGANFANKPTLTLTWSVPPLPPSGGYIVPSAQVTFISSTQLQMSITTTMSPDTWTVKVNNPDGKVSNTTPFTVR